MKTYHHVIVRFELQGEEEMAKLVSLITELEKTVKRSPDFVSAKLHRNREGTVLINYATWTSFEAYKTFWKEYVIDTETNKKIESYKLRVDHVFGLDL